MAENSSHQTNPAHVQSRDSWLATHGPEARRQRAAARMEAKEKRGEDVGRARETAGLEAAYNAPAATVNNN